MPLPPMPRSRRAKMPELSHSERILVIDDQETTRYVFRRILSGAGYKVTEAKTGAEGLAKALEDPDIIIADVNLPDMLGYDLCRRLKSNPATSAIPVLQISASFISDESRVQALEGGADSYLTQPVEPPVLVASVTALLRMRKAEAMSRLSALQWQTTFDSLSDGLALADAEGVILRANGRFMQMLLSAPSELEGVPLSTIFTSKFNLSFDEFLEQQREGLGTEVSYDNRWFRLRYDVVQPDGQNVRGSVL